jgi:hypothetical protein
MRCCARSARGSFELTQTIRRPPWVRGSPVSMARFDARRAGSRRWRPPTPRQWRTAGRSPRHPWSGRHVSQVPGSHTAPERPLFLLWISVDTWITVPRCGEDVLVTEGAGSSRRLKPSSPVRPSGTRCGLPGNPVRFPLSHQILTSVPTEFPPVGAGGRFLGQDRAASQPVRRPQPRR